MKEDIENEITKFVASISAGNKHKATRHLKLAIEKKVADKIKNTLQEKHRN